MNKNKQNVQQGLYTSVETRMYCHSFVRSGKGYIGTLPRVIQLVALVLVANVFNRFHFYSKL